MTIRVRSKRRAARSFAGTVIAAASAAVLAGACSGTSMQSVTVTPAQLVAESAHTTLAQKTADLTLSGAISVAGQHVPLQGTGVADFDSHAMSMDVSTSVSGISMKINELLVSGQLYMSGEFSGGSFKDLTGKDWISLPLPTNAQDLYGSDPFAQLKVLEQEGAAVTPLGQKTLGGRTVSGYSIVPTRESMLKAAQGELSQMGFDQSQATQIQNLIQQSQPPTIVAWFDSTHLLRQISMSLSMGGVAAGGSGGGSAGGGSVNMEMDVDHYGVPVHITAPAPSDVVSFKQFLQEAQQAGSSSN